MKSKKWLISLGLAVVLVVAFALPACEPEPKEYWYTPGGERITFEITTMPGEWADMALFIVGDLQDLGMDVERRVINSMTYYNKLYYPNTNGWDAFISGEDPSPDPWSDWIWQLLSDPYGWVAEWNPTWYNNNLYNALWVANYLAPNLAAKQGILYGMQQILAGDLPVIYLTRDDIITVRRNDRWDNWFNEMGGYATWINEYSIREVTNKTADDQLKIGTMTLVDNLNVDNLNMDQETLMYTNIGCLYLMLVYENLAFYPKIDAASMEANPGAAYEFVPKLATNYSITYEDDGTGGQNQVWTIDLREGVKWHDYDTSGKNMTADDVVYTLKHVTNKWGVNKPIDWTAVVGNILPGDVLAEKTGEHQVTFTFIAGWHQSENFFPSVYMWDAVVPKHIFEPDSRDPWEWDGDSIGTGPYKVKEFVADDHLLLERNNAYWGPLPAAEKVLFQLYADTESMLIALEKGDIDVTMVQGAPHQKIVEYMANPDIEVEIVPDLAVNYLGFNLHPTAGYAPLQDKVLRQAIAYAIDKQDIIDIALGGYGQIPDAWTYNESPNHDPALPQYTFNTTTARNMLLAAGYTYKE